MLCPGDRPIIADLMAFPRAVETNVEGFDLQIG